MGQKSSKRQSYTPGGTQDAGLPTAALAENGDIKSGGANGQVQLISSRESPAGDVITTDVMSPSSVAATASSPTSANGKKKRKPRSIFSLKRTGSGKRSRRSKKEANGVRPTSYPPALSAEETAGPRATERDRKAQSMFVEAVSEKGQEVVAGPSTFNDEETEAGKDQQKSPSPKKTSSSDAGASPSKAQTDRKRNGSQKQKSPSKKKEKNPKKKSKKKKEETDKTRREEEAGDKAATEGTDNVKEEGRTDDGATAAAAAAAVVVEDVVAPEVEMTQEQTPSAQATSSATNNGSDYAKATNEDTDDATAEDGKEETKEQAAEKEEPAKEVMAVTTSTVTESEIQLSFPEHTPAEAEAEEERPALTAEQLLAEIEETILKKEGEPIDFGTEANSQLKEADETGPGQQGLEHTGEVITVQTPLKEEVELAGQGIREDILELINISSHATEPDQQAEEPVTEAAGGGDTETEVNTQDTQDSPSEVTKEVVEMTMTADVLSTIEAARLEPASGTVQQQGGPLPESTGSAETSTKAPEDGAVQEMDGNERSPPEQDSGAPRSPAPGPGEDSKLEASASEPMAGGTSQAAEDAPPPLTPAQLKALEKERKAARKREEKERAKRDKEEKKRLKEEKMREAKEKKKREKEEKERRLREAKEKVRAAANFTLEVREGQVVQAAPEEPVGSSYVKVVDSPPDLPAPQDIAAPKNIAPRGDEEKTVVVEPLPTTSSESVERGQDVQQNLGEEGAHPPVPPDAPSTPSTPPPVTPPTTEIGKEEEVLGSSVKEIICAIENNAVEPETHDGNNPPEVPDAPYPVEEDTMQQSSAAAQFSSPPTSPDSSTLTSPVAGKSAEDTAQPASSETASEPAARSVFTPEVSESARSSVLRKIELGPRLRTAILRKSSSGAEEEKRVSLTQPRHVQISDLTPPPRKPRARRPLEHTRDSSGNFRYSCPALSGPELVLEEHVTVEVASLNTSLPSVNLSEQREVTDCLAADSRANEVSDVTEDPTAVLTSDSPPAQPSSPPSQTESSEEQTGDLQQENNVLSVDQLTQDLTSPGRGLLAQTEPEPPSLVVVASLLQAGQKDPADSPPTQPPDQPAQPGERGKEQAELHPAVSEEGQSPPDDLFLQKVAAEVVVHVQKAAQEKACALELQEKLVQEVGDSNGQVVVRSEVGDDSVKCQESEAEGSEQAGQPDCSSDSDCDGGAALVQATVVCSAELVAQPSQCATRSAVSSTADHQSKQQEELQPQDSCGTVVDSEPTPPGTGSSEVQVTQPQTDKPEVQVTDTQACPCANQQSQAVAETAVGVEETDVGSTEPGQDGEVAVTGETKASSSSPSESNTAHKAGDGQDANEDEENADGKTGEEDSPDTFQLQHFNKNYHDISVVVDNDDDDASKIPAVDPVPADNRDEKGDRAEEPAGGPQISEESSPPSKDTSSLQQDVPPQTSLESSSQLENREALEADVEQSEQQDKVRVSVCCNGSHVQNAGGALDALLKLHSGLNGEKDLVRETVEHNNNLSTEEKTTPERTESPSTGSTSDSRD